MHAPKTPQQLKSKLSWLRRTYNRLHHFYFRYLFKRDTILASLSVFLVIGLFGILPLNTSILNPFKTALKDLDFNDIAYSVLKKNNDMPFDNRIVIVNIGHADRLGLAMMIEKLNAGKPKVIGLDVLFDGPRDPMYDSVMQKTVINTPNLIIAFRIDFTNKELPEQQSYFGKYTNNRAFVNLVGEEGGTIRNFSPAETINKINYQSFPAALVRIGNPKEFQKLTARKKPVEIINYSRSIEKYMLLEGQDVLEGKVAPEFFQDKIVLMGFINPDPTNIEDKHFTPFNKNFAGKSIPDMDGIVIHANIISMILDENYVRKIPAWLLWIINIVVCWLHVALFMRYYIEEHIWFHLVAKIAQIFFAILSVFVGILFFKSFNIKLDTKISLIVIILAIDVIYFYEAFAVWAHNKFGFQTNFHSKTH